MNLTYGKYKFDAYESNLDPILRVIHLTGIKAAGWIKINKFEILEWLIYTCQTKRKILEQI